MRPALDARGEGQVALQRAPDAPGSNDTSLAPCAIARQTSGAISNGTTCGATMSTETSGWRALSGVIATGADAGEFDPTANERRQFLLQNRSVAEGTLGAAAPAPDFAIRLRANVSA